VRQAGLQTFEFNERNFKPTIKAPVFLKKTVVVKEDPEPMVEEE